MEKIHYARERHKSQVSFYILCKRIIDIVVSIILLLCLSPFLLLFSLAILIFSGRPIFFKQNRTGKHNQPFTIWKFRTMQQCPNPEKAHHYQWQTGYQMISYLKRQPSKKLRESERFIESSVSMNYRSCLMSYGAT